MDRTFPVFNDGNGNLFVITSYFFDEENPCNYSEHAMVLAAMPGFTEEEEKLVVTQGVKTKGIATFLNIGEYLPPLHVLIISGPIYDEATEREASIDAAVEATVTNATFH